MSDKKFKIRLFALVVAASCGVLTACGSAGDASSGAAGAAPAVVFDVPALVGKNIDQVEQALGKADAAPEPTEEEQSLVGFEWKKTFTKSGYRLTAKYYPDSKQVYAFALLGKNNAPESASTDELEAVANVAPGSPRYYIEMTPESGSQPKTTDPNAPPPMPRFVGITVVPVADTAAALAK